MRHIRQFFLDDVDLARRWQARSLTDSQRAELVARRRFMQEFPCRDGDIALGRVEGPKGWTWAGIPIERLLGSHTLITGATGMGKSRLIAALIYQLLRARVPIVVVDQKSELATITLEHLAKGVTPIRVVRPFSENIPLLRLTAPEPGVSREIQALNLAASLAEAVGSDLGIRMHRVFLRMSSLAIEKNKPLQVVAEWISNPLTFVAEARSSADPQVRHYATQEFQREHQVSLDALRARLDELFHLKEIRLALSAPSCLSFADTLEEGLSVFDFGSPPAGAESASRFIAGPVLGRIQRAILSRRDTSKPCILILEEFQECLGRHQIDHFKRLVSLARFKNVSLLFSNQQVAQIADVDPMLLRVLRTNVALEMIFRSSIEDASALAKGLSVRRQDESQSAARTRFIEEIASLRRREYFLWVKDAAFGPQRLRSPKMDLDELPQLTAEERLENLRGTVSIPADQVHEPVQQYPDELPPKRKTRGLG